MNSIERDRNSQFFSPVSIFFDDIEYLVSVVVHPICCSVEEHFLVTGTVDLQHHRSFISEFRKEFGHLAPVDQRVDNFIHWISHYPEEQMYSNQCFWQVFHTIPFLNLTFASTLFTNYRTIGKILHTFYLPDSELSSG